MLEIKIDIYVHVSVNNVDPDEVAHDEPPHLELHCLPSTKSFTSEYDMA